MSVLHTSTCKGKNTWTVVWEKQRVCVHRWLDTEGRSVYWRGRRKDGAFMLGKQSKYQPVTDVLTQHPLPTRFWWRGPGLPGSYWASSAQGLMAVMEMLCPLHLKTPASHSDIVSSLPFTSTQMLYPASWHSDASLQTHLLFWAGKSKWERLNGTLWRWETQSTLSPAK